jgi:hypothetical protein
MGVLFVGNMGIKLARSDGSTNIYGVYVLCGGNKATLMCCMMMYDGGPIQL